MVAYSFQRRFAEPIQTGRKTHTMRPQRKRHARVGEPVQLYCGMRTRNCFKILDTDPICTRVVPILLGPWGIEIDGVQIRDYEKRNEYAVTDGFENWRQLRRFFIQTYGTGTWEGVLVEWERTHG